MERETLCCLRCGARMRFLGRERIQLGQTSWLLGDLPNLIAGAMVAEIFSCPKCGKIELFQAEDSADELPQKQCPGCGAVIDFDYGRCPRCRHEF